MMQNVGQEEFAQRREDMARWHLRERGINDPLVLAAFNAVPRELFIPEELRAQAYDDHPLSIGLGQTISQPYIVALMLQLLRLKPADQALDVGAGSGYVTALLAQICRQVCGVERLPELAGQASARLAALHLNNARVKTGDGTLGWPEEAPFDAIIVGAAAPRPPAALKDQLADRGRLILPVGGRFGQELILVERIGDRFAETSAGGCIFVPLIGAEGWKDPY